MESLKSLLSSHEETRIWLAHLETIGPPDFDVGLPPADELRTVLLELAVPHEDINPLLRMLPTRERSADLWWLLERCVHSLVREMGNIEGPPTFRALPERVGALHHYFYVYVFLAVLPHVRAYYRAHGIPDQISWLTLADLGRNMAVYRWRNGVGGLHAPFWLMLHLRGAIYDLGRLQFQRARLGSRTGQAVARAGLPFGPGDLALSVHIPEFSGPMTQRACDASFARAKEFFARHFPDEPYHIATCHSWLLDDQLAEYLPEDSNIIRFQRRFQPAYRPDDDDETILRFVFGRVPADLDELPQRTTLHRVVVGHLKAGHHWRGGAGWLAL